MADPISKPATGSAGREPSARRSSRLQVAGKLTALLGLPLAILGSIFAGGMYCGVTRADRVVELEQRWLGVEPPAGRLDAGAGAGAGESSDPGVTADTPEPDAVEPKPTEPKPTEPKPIEPKPIQPTPIEPTTVEPAPQPTDAVASSAPGLIVATPDPVGPELRARFDEPQVVRLHLLIDPALVVAHEDWLGYVAELFDATQVSFDRLFGIDLQLHGVVVWESAVGADAKALLADLASRNQQGADMVIGLVAREAPKGFAPTPWIGSETGDHALVFADLAETRSGGDRYYRNLLRALSGLFGAEPTVDPAAKQLGSFMTPSGLPTGDAAPAGAGPVLDPENRGKVIINKRRPIADSSASSGASDGQNPDEPKPKSDI